MLVNSTMPAEAFQELGDYNIFPIDGKAIAGRNGLGRIVNSVLLGALAGFLDAPDFKNLQSVVEDMSPVKINENLSSCRDGYELARKFKGVLA